MSTTRDLTIMAIRTDVTVIATHYTQAWRTMDDQVAGWPAQTPGANPDSSHTSSLDPEPLQLTQARDKVQRDRQTAYDLERQICKDVKRLADLYMRYAGTHHTETTVARTLAAIPLPTDRCRTPGCDRPPHGRATECSWCEEFRGAYGSPAPMSLLEVREFRKINTADIARHMARAYGDDWKKRIPKQKPVPDCVDA